MRSFLGLLAVIFLALGFYSPFAWGASIIFAILAIGDSERKHRSEERNNNNGLLN